MSYRSSRGRRKSERARKKARFWKSFRKDPSDVDIVTFVNIRVMGCTQRLFLAIKKPVAYATRRQRRNWECTGLKARLNRARDRWNVAMADYDFGWDHERAVKEPVNVKYQRVNRTSSDSSGSLHATVCETAT